MEKAKDFYSKNVADAIRQACAAFATSQEKLDIEVVETGSAGIFGLCRKRAHIRVTRKKRGGSPSQAGKSKAKTSAAGHAEAKKDEIPAAVPQEPAAEPEQDIGRDGGGSRPLGRKTDKIREKIGEVSEIPPPTEEVLSSVRSDLIRVLDLMGFASEVSVTFDDGAIQCQIEGEHVASIVGPGGRALDSLQYLLRKMAGRDLPDRMLIDLNAGDFRERRREELKKTAAELAEKVKADGKTQAIPALNPSERRVVHVALQDEISIRSRSVGDGLFKKVLIYKPGSKSKKSGGRRRGRQGGGSAGK